MNNHSSSGEPNIFAKLVAIWGVLTPRGHGRFVLTFGMAPAALVAAVIVSVRGYWYLGLLLILMMMVCIYKMADGGWRYLVVEGNRNQWTLKGPDIEEARGGNEPDARGTDNPANPSL